MCVLMLVRSQSWPAPRVLSFQYHSLLSIFGKEKWEAEMDMSPGHKEIDVFDLFPLGSLEGLVSEELSLRELSQLRKKVSIA